MRHEQHVSVVYPNEIFRVLTSLSHFLGKDVVDLVVHTPELLLVLVEFKVVQTLEVVEKWSKDVFMELQKLLDGLGVQEGRHTVELFQARFDFLPFLVVLGHHTWPSDPNSLHSCILLLERKQSVVQDGVAGSR